MKMNVVDLRINGIAVTSVEVLSMKETDVLFVTFTGDNPDRAMLQHLHQELERILGHDRFMIMHKEFKLQLVSGKKVEEEGAETK